ncbi:glutathione S-transferase family protein [Pseudoponticoccus marisrubri]|uniref:Glutathione-dependent reductase n=1 Tax=Pseudoponticoccus marisrubri TaxID=1685382 RepID=A0A0W7WKJ0_9RHOB|nr:glutathione S-transferase family protein [Pseudoponticoccus marisrubri]KUF11046.1 glutathione-dependent reductase [Pseudoponticoccus marisrubri]
MGQLVNGEWKTGQVAPTSKDGSFQRQDSSFRNWVTSDGRPGPSGEGGFEAARDRYHLYVSYACPWAHRALIFRKLKGLEDLIGVSVVHPDMLDDGWTFDLDRRGATGDRLYGSRFMREIYTRAEPRATTKVTVPVLWDRQYETIVSNESAEIIRMFNSAFDGLTGNSDDYWPAHLRDEIEPVNARIYDTVNNGVYKAGFARSQEAYDAAVGPLFETLDWIEERLSRRRYLMGAQVTEADWRLFTTLIRFDKVYHGHFKCNRNRIVDFPNMWGYLRELYQWPGVAETVDFDHITRHYHYSHETVNPHRIVPIGPALDLTAPHGRGALAAA